VTSKTIRSTGTPFCKSLILPLSKIKNPNQAKWKDKTLINYIDKNVGRNTRILIMIDIDINLYTRTPNDYAGIVYSMKML